METIWEAILKDPGKVGFNAFLVVLCIYLLYRQKVDRGEVVSLTKQYEDMVKGLVQTLTVLAERLEKK